MSEVLAPEYDFLDRGFDDEERQQPVAKGQADPHDGHLHGFVYGMTFEDYAAVEALNGSKIVNMRRSAMYYKHLLDNPQPETPALTLGTITHRMILEPQTSLGVTVWLPEEGMKVRNGKKWEKFKEDHADTTIITKAEYSDCVNMATGVLNNEPIRKYAHAAGPTEVCMFWRDPLTGRRMKARLDKLITSTHTIFDLKTTRDCRSFRFGSQAYTLGYHIKAALYMQGYETLTGIKPNFRLGAIESKAPHESAVFRVTPDVFAQGWEEMEHLVGRITECEKKEAFLLSKGKPTDAAWPAEHGDETDLLLPAWAQYQELDQYEDAA